MASEPSFRLRHAFLQKLVRKNLGFAMFCAKGSSKWTKERISRDREFIIPHLCHFVVAVCTGNAGRFSQLEVLGNNRR